MLHCIVVVVVVIVVIVVIIIVVIVVIVVIVIVDVFLHTMVCVGDVLLPGTVDNEATQHYMQFLLDIIVYFCSLYFAV